MSAWKIKRQKVKGNKAKHHLALMRQQLDLRTINNMQWDPFRNIKDAVKWEVIITVPYDPLEKLYCFPSSDVVRSLRAAGWIEAQHYIVDHHIDYDTYWKHVSHDALMSDIVRCGNIDIPGLRALTNGVTFPRVEFPTADFTTQETQIPPPRLGDYPRWIMELGSAHGTTWHTIPSIASTSTIEVPTGYDFFVMTEGMRKFTLDWTFDLGLKSNGKMKRELLKRGLHVGRVHGGGVRGEGHLKVGPLLPDDQDVPRDLLFSIIWVLTGIVC
ncbi:hypothetical protein GIB67_022306 [Kingdonia uniflora]|uniref:Uncharacterized protein n=1 Tax=Kingdonia uniflora TaxID=39325 RepID=A0A7J7KW33_9MAGN|nr:hypothetical protein GIB67_022306 [Kingdonia uniflora]